MRILRVVIPTVLLVTLLVAGCSGGAADTEGAVASEDAVTFQTPEEAITYYLQGVAEADLDKDDQTSLWEAYLAASRRTAEFYAADGRLQTEHALLDDNGDQQGTRADIFQGLKLKDDIETADALDGLLAHQWHLVPSEQDAKLPPDIRRRRDDLELKIIELRRRKSQLDEDNYFQKLETLLVELARLNLRG